MLFATKPISVGTELRYDYGGGNLPWRKIKHALLSPFSEPPAIATAVAPNIPRDIRLFLPDNAVSAEVVMDDPYGMCHDSVAATDNAGESDVTRGDSNKGRVISVGDASDSGPEVDNAVTMEVVVDSASKSMDDICRESNADTDNAGDSDITCVIHVVDMSFLFVTRLIQT